MRVQHSILALIATLALAVPVDRASAQQRRDMVAAGLGAASATMTASTASTHTTGIIFNVRYAIGISPSSRAVLDYESQPFWIAHPKLDERFVGSYFIGGIQWYLTDNFYILPGIGGQFRHWGGTARDIGADIGAAAGFNAGYELALANKVTLAPEFDSRYALVDPSRHVLSWTLGAHIVIARHF